MSLVPPAAPPGPLDPTAREQDIRRILAVARSLTGFDVAWVSRFDRSSQVFTHVEAAPGAGPMEGSAGDLAGSFCVRVLDGRLPAYIPNVSLEPGARDLAVTQALEIAAYAGVPLVGADGTVRGMLCITDPRAAVGFTEQQQATLEMLGQVLGALVDDGQAESEEERRGRVQAAIEGAGRHHVLQAIVDVRSGRAVGTEALARFDSAPFRPDAWFAEAEAAGLRVELEEAAARTALGSLDSRDGYLSINLSPRTVKAGALDRLLVDVDRSRVVVELTEHAPVRDYERLNAALDPHRAAGLRVAVDDAGAGYASFRHIIQLRPDYIKIDLSLVRDIHLDPVRQALAASLLMFARTAGAQVIAEGVETQLELDALYRLGVSLMQGYLLGRPTAAPPPAGYVMPSRHVLLNDGEELTTLLATVVRGGAALEDLARPVLDAVLRITGLESSFLTLRTGDELEQRYVRNTGLLEVQEGATLTWEEAFCSGMQEQRLTWTKDGNRDLADRPLARAMGLTTYLTTPLTAADGTMVGTLCAGSSQAVYISDAAVAQVQLIAHVISGVVAKERGRPE